MALCELVSFDAALKNLYPKSRIDDLVVNTSGSIYEPSPESIANAKRVRAERAAWPVEQHLDYVIHYREDSLTEIEMAAVFVGSERGISEDDIMEQLYARPLMKALGYSED